MSNYGKLAAEAGDQYLNLLVESQEQFLKSLNAFTAAAPAMYAVPTPPVAADIPTPREIAEANFAFAAKFLKQQKAFAEKLFAAMTPSR